MSTIPGFDDLPKVEGMPQGCAWGIFDKDGKKDLLGTLNLLTPDVVAAAAAEVKDGISISLKYVCLFTTTLVWSKIHRSFRDNSPLLTRHMQLAPQRQQDPHPRTPSTYSQNLPTCREQTRMGRYPRVQHAGQQLVGQSRTFSAYAVQAGIQRLTGH